MAENQRETGLITLYTSNDRLGAHLVMIEGVERNMSNASIETQGLQDRIMWTFIMTGQSPIPKRNPP